MNVNDIFPNGLNINDALDLLWPVTVYILGLTAYALFIFKFYRFVAARDMFKLDLSRYQESRHRWVRGFLHVTMYTGKYIILFPVFAFFWFAVLTLILTFLSKDRAFSDILLLALATVSTVRVTAYYKEELSRDLAKILPFAVLAIFLIDASFFTVSESLDVLKGAKDYTENILYYLVFLIALEFVLRLLMGVVLLLVRVKRRLFNRTEPTPEVASPPLAEESSPQEDDHQ